MLVLQEIHGEKVYYRTVFQCKHFCRTTLSGRFLILQLARDEATNKKKMFMKLWSNPRKLPIKIIFYTRFDCKICLKFFFYHHNNVHRLTSYKIYQKIKVNNTRQQDTKLTEDIYRLL